MNGNGNVDGVLFRHLVFHLPIVAERVHLEVQDAVEATRYEELGLETGEEDGPGVQLEPLGTAVSAATERTEVAEDATEAVTEVVTEGVIEGELGAGREGVAD